MFVQIKRQADIYLAKKTDTQQKRQTNRQILSQKDRQTDRYLAKKTDKQTDTQPKGQTYIRKQRQTNNKNKRSYRQTHRSDWMERNGQLDCSKEIRDIWV